jgi:hypothetical protein
MPPESIIQRKLIDRLPLAHIFGAVRLSHRAVLIKFYLDNRNSALYRDLPSHDGQQALAPSPESSVIKLTILHSTGTLPSRD